MDVNDEWILDSAVKELMAATAMATETTAKCPGRSTAWKSLDQSRYHVPRVYRSYGFLGELKIYPGIFRANITDSQRRKSA